MEVKNNSSPKYNMTENIRKIMELDDRPMRKSGYLVHRGEDEGRFSETLEYINYRSFLDGFFN